MRRIWFVVAFLVSLFLSPSWAASSVSVNGNVAQIVNYVSSDSENIKLNAVVKGSAANEPYAARVIQLRQSKFLGWFKPQIGSLIRGGAWWAAFAMTVEGAGWAIDELRNQVVSADPYAIAGQVWYAYGYNTEFFATSDEALLSFCEKYMSGATNCQIVSRKVLASNALGATRIYFEFTYTDSAGATKSYTWTTYRNPCSDKSSTVSSCNDGFSNKKPVSDADLLTAVNAQLAADPDYAANAFTDPATGRVAQDLFDPVPYIPGLSAIDEALVNCYISGQLQMSNPSGACYVATQAEYDAVKKMAEDLAADKTPEKQVELLNSQLKQPITKAEYDASNLTYESQQASSLSTALANANDPFNQLKLDSDFIIEKITTPAEPPKALDFFEWSLPTGSCSGFNVDFSVGNGKLHTTKHVSEFCGFYSSVAHPLLFWFLNILTFLYVWWLWDRSVSDMAR